GTHQRPRHASRPACGSYPCRFASSPCRSDRLRSRRFRQSVARSRPYVTDNSPVRALRSAWRPLHRAILPHRAEPEHPWSLVFMNGFVKELVKKAIRGPFGIAQIHAQLQAQHASTAEIHAQLQAQYASLQQQLEAIQQLKMTEN